MNKAMKLLSVVLVIIFGLCIISLFELHNVSKEHNQWVKTIQAPSEGRLILNDREKPNCKIDSVIGDSVRIITIVHRKNIFKK